ncbi:hypothetical protein ACIHCV_42780 [Streptomyces sp. NPDC051956]|uniref:hypothetical protein n=1 Tax=Streptomyces sp. NPDC051956 TaxID=3365677 RepID=UPI0037D2D32E
MTVRQETADNLLRAGRIDLEALVPHRLPLAEVNQAIDLMRSGEALRVPGFSRHAAQHTAVTNGQSRHGRARDWVESTVSPSASSRP